MTLTQVSTAGVKDDAVTSGKIPANAVGSSELADNAVDTNAIANDAVTAAKIADNAINSTSMISGALIGTGQITNSAVTGIKIADGTIGTSKLESGVTDLSNDTSPQLGGDLDANGQNIAVDGGNNITIGNNGRLRLGANNLLDIYQTGTNGFIENTSGSLNISTVTGAVDINKSSAEYMGRFLVDGAVELYHNNVKRIETESNGATLTGARLRIQNSGNADFNLRDTSTNAVSAYIGAKTAGKVEYNCYKEGVGTKYPHVFVGYTEEYARIDTNGIKFNGDTASANALDDYEVGSWSPSIANGTFTLYNQAWYIKIGKLVTCYFYIYNFSDTSSSTQFVIGGLPYAYNNSPKHESFFEIQHGGNGGSFNTDTIGIQGRIGQKSDTEVEVRQQRFNNTSQSLLHSNLGSVHLHTTFSYEAA